MNKRATEKQIRKYKRKARERYEELKKSSQWYECPKCGKAWALLWNGIIHFYDFDPPKGSKISGKKLCINCDEIIIDGRRFGEEKKLLVEKGSNINNFKCPMCKGDDFKIESEEGIIDRWTCKYCGCRSNIDFDSKTGEVCEVLFREDLTRKEFKKTLEEIAEILKTEGVLIRKGDGGETELKNEMEGEKDQREW